MGVAVIVTTQHVESTLLSDWNAACGKALREALDGAESVRLVDANGAEYNVWAEPVEDNS
jgi:hypothetical protein